MVYEMQARAVSWIGRLYYLVVDGMASLLLTTLPFWQSRLTGLKILCWTMTAIIGVEVHHGFGVYDKDVPASTVAKLVVVNNNLWILVIHFTKASILVQYLRIFDSHRTRVLCLILMFLLLPAACWGIFGGTFLCSPTAKLWKPRLPGHCMSAQRYWYSVAGIDIGLDFLVLMIPLPAITKLRMPRKQKIGLMLVFLLGFFVCIVSVVRLLTVLVTSLRGQFVASGVWAIIWSSVEANVGIVCASLLALKPLAVKLFPKLMNETQLPKHSMQLPMIEAGVWPGGSDQEKLKCSRSASVPTTPTTIKSKESSFGTRRPRAARVSSSHHFWSPPRLSEVENIDIVEREDTPASGRTRERLSLFDILREDVDEARERTERRDSSFREHV